MVGHGDLNHRDAALDLALVVFAQPAVPAQPAEGPLDDPAFGQNRKALGIVVALDDLDLPAQTPGGLRELLA